MMSNEYAMLLNGMILHQQEQVDRNNEYAKRSNRHHPSHNDYAEGVRDGLQKAYDLLQQMARNEQ